MESVDLAYMAFLEEGGEGFGAVTETRQSSIVIYVENAGEFVVPRSAIHSVHDKKVILKRDALEPALIEAIRHVHDREDPRVLG